MMRSIFHRVWARVALLGLLLATLWGASGCCGIRQPITGPVARTVTAAVEPSAPPTIAPTQTAATAPPATLTAVPSVTMTAAPPATATLFPSITPSSAPSARPTALPTATRVPTPVCRLPVDAMLEIRLPLDQLGCPLGPAQIIWSAWQPFERGYMLWRSDTNQVTVFYADGTQQTLPDQWNERPYSIGAPPPGRVAPVRGFGWIWTTRPEIAARIGWGLVEEKGFCARIQSFEKGFALRSVGGACSDQLNRANEPSFTPVHLEALYAGTWLKH